jgi:GntR family transcriptional regulator/MocR family aminotransferase
MADSPAPINVSIDPGDRSPAFRQIARQLRRAIASGELHDGIRLPTSRALAVALGVARNTIIEAYMEVASSGFIKSRGRLGTFVVAPRASRNRGGKHTTRFSPMLLARVAKRGQPSPRAGQIDLSPGSVCADMLPLTVWRAACREAGRHLPPADYGDSRGDRGLRESICTWMSRQRATKVSSDQIVVTHGAGQAIDLLIRVLVRPGDVCAVEDPGYPLAADLLRRAGAILVPMPVDAQGARVETALERSPVPMLIHLTPAHQYPLGGRLSGPRRLALVAGVRSNRSLVIENEYDHEFVHAGQALPPLLQTAPDAVVLVSTFAKALSPALRLGFIAAQPALAAALADIIHLQRTQVSWPTQRIVDFMLRSGELDRHLRRVRRHYARLRYRIRTTIASIGPHLMLHGDDGGLHVALLTNPPELARTLQSALRDDGILLDGLDSYAVSKRALNGLVLAYGHLTETQLARILEQIAARVKDLVRSRRLLSQK